MQTKHTNYTVNLNRTHARKWEERKWGKEKGGKGREKKKEGEKASVIKGKKSRVRGVHCTAMQ